MLASSSGPTAILSGDFVVFTVMKPTSSDVLHQRNNSDQSHSKGSHGACCFPCVKVPVVPVDSKAITVVESINFAARWARAMSSSEGLARMFFTVTLNIEKV